MRYILEQLPNYIYSKDRITKKWLDRNGFLYNRILSDVDCDAYSLRFPVYRYGDFICIDSEITVFTKTKEIRVDCYDHNTRDCYARWYCRDVGRDETLMTLVTSQVEKKLKSLGIKMELPSNWNILIDESKNIDENFE